MQFLVTLRLSSSAHPTSPAEGSAFIEDVVLPTLERCEKLQRDKVILAGGPLSSAVGLVLIVSTESVQALDDLITSLPIWPRAQTEVVPLNTFEGRRQSLLPMLQSLKARLRESGTSAPRAAP